MLSEAYLVLEIMLALMTIRTLRSKSKLLFLPVALLTLSMIVIDAAYGSIWGYQAVKPSGSFNEVIGVKGNIFPYKGGINGANQHVDRMAYLTDTANFSVGIGYYDYTDASNVERYRIFRYWDNGIDNNFHLLTSTDPSTWFTAEVIAISSTIYDFKINGASIGTRSCSTSCPNPTIAGTASWGTGTTSSMNVNANHKDLQLRRDTDSAYQSWNAVANELKCDEAPNTLGIEYPLANNNIDQIIIDATTAHECLQDNSSPWLYNGGAGG